MPKELSREELLDKIEETAHDYERDYHGCSRCVFRALQEHLNLGDGSAFLASTALGGGIATMGDTCGAMLGGVLAVGIATASPDMKDGDALNNTLMNSFRYARRFVRAIGSSRCRDIQADKLGEFFNMLEPEGYEGFVKAGGYRECSKVAGQAARIAANFIFDMWEREKAAREQK